MRDTRKDSVYFDNYLDYQYSRIKKKTASPAKKYRKIWLKLPIKFPMANKPKTRPDWTNKGSLLFIFINPSPKWLKLN